MYQYLLLVKVLPLGFFDLLPDEDKFWQTFFWRGLFPFIKVKVCKQRGRIQKRQISVEVAEKSIPRPDLKIEAIKKRHRDLANQSAADVASKAPDRVVSVAVSPQLAAAADLPLPPSPPPHPASTLREIG